MWFCYSARGGFALALVRWCYDLKRFAKTSKQTNTQTITGFHGLGAGLLRFGCGFAVFVSLFVSVSVFVCLFVNVFVCLSVRL